MRVKDVVVDERGSVVGMTTDRDICIALGTRNIKASEVSVEDVSLPRGLTCRPEQEVHAAHAVQPAELTVAVSV
jgi:hypothetical protein